MTYIEHGILDHKAGVILFVILGLSAMGGVWAVWWAGTTWRTEPGKITSIQDKYTELVLVGKVLVLEYWTHLHVSYAWNGTNIDTPNTASGWQWNVNQTVSAVYDRTNGNLISIS